MKKMQKTELIKNKTHKNLNIKNIKGITLIALVITIIVILILARNKHKHVIWR